MVLRKEESGIRINYMALQKLHIQLVALFGGNRRIIKKKDMEHKSGLVENDILGSICRILNMGMEYSHGQMKVYIKDNGYKIAEKVMDITGGHMAMSIMDSTRMMTSTEREY